MIPEEIKDKYEERIKRLLDGVCESLKEEGLSPSEPLLDTAYDEHTWSVYITHGLNPGPTSVDLRFIILESEHNDGEEEGVNFSIDATSTEGEMVAGVTPGNYSPDLWVNINDDEAIEKRFELVEGMDHGELVHLICEHMKPVTSEDVEEPGLSSS